jgi:hypothetical protein
MLYSGYHRTDKTENKVKPVWMVKNEYNKGWCTMYRLITGRTHYYAPAANIVMAVTISGSPSEEELKTAIQKAIDKHEIFSNKVILDDNGDSFYLAILPKQIELEIREMKEKDDWKQLIKEQERIPFDFPHGELIRFFLLKKETERKLIIVANHLAGDGLAILFFLRDIMTALGNPETEYDRIPVQLMDDFGFPKDSKLKRSMRLALKQINKSWNKHKKIFNYEEYLAMFRDYWQNRRLDVVEDEICGTNLQNLIAKCKENRLTMNSAIAAAFLFASKELKEIGMAVSVRPKGYEGMGNYASGISIQFVPNYKKTFWKNAQAIHRLIYKKLKNNGEKYFVLQFLKGMDPTLIDATYFASGKEFRNKSAVKAREWFGYNENQQIAIGISNLAKPKIAKNYGKYAMEQVEFVPPLLPNNKIVLGIVTVEDRMTITMQYEQSKDSEKTLKTFEDAMKLLKLESSAGDKKG